MSIRLFPLYPFEEGRMHKSRVDGKQNSRKPHIRNLGRARPWAEARATVSCKKRPPTLVFASVKYGEEEKSRGGL